MRNLVHELGALAQDDRNRPKVEKILAQMGPRERKDFDRLARQMLKDATSGKPADASGSTFADKWARRGEARG